ncbi:sigma-54-dependent transcriptional regulator [Niabella drilacis]|uniref:DNA-binding transcriptional response regulator, NtrC family, contains REC, AAA-type ATPase, and a Fis-type DNA-binding domains n=1 Tax=Niabella drilacis (strain DSM 25811 / CCM 8410 / CCUG 62505 / LMG 26954 / E90) TaxID=1285928 RepID=A0A1G6J8B2_NIADE|nr:sigma-54 dependent transcriptional regulator [Niabella drilacis]SDC14927.1 DNA-binding transcriptional response regulator, NtrC family, contains REC, AAA-type ATPase, and a Fis-type DNA-binding domains [Niabella drilacis]
MKHSVLIIDDEEKLRQLLSRIITLEGFEVFQAGDGRSGLKLLEKTGADVVLCDVKLPDDNGVELVKKIKAQAPQTEVILLTAYGNIPDGVQAIKNGAFDYITKGDDNNRIIPLLNRALEKAALHKRVQQLEQQLGNKYSFDSVIGHSEAIQQAVLFGRKVAPTDATVLFTGETGTGKEVFARAIHEASNRKNKSFVAINCAAFSRELLEGELFGHRAGSFTGAVKDQAGLLEEAHNGTLFLDEIGEMATDLQAKLLRVLESGEFIKIGETRPTKINLRLLAATNRNLLKEIESGQFREDLYYRISTFKINLPALRERKKDIKELAVFYLRFFAEKTNRKLLHISPEAFRALENYNWPGNIRELKNSIERSVILMQDDELHVDDLPLEIQQYQHPGADAGENPSSLASMEKNHIRRILQFTKGNKAEAARILEIGVATLYRKIDEYRL